MVTRPEVRKLVATTTRRRKGEINATEVSKPSPNAKWKHSGQLSGNWSHRRDKGETEPLLKAEREKKYLLFSLSPDFQPLTYASYWPNSPNARVQGKLESGAPSNM